MIAKEADECSEAHAGEEGYVPMLYLDPVHVLQQTFADPDLLRHIMITPYRTYEGTPADGLPKNPSDRRVYDEVYSADYAWAAQVGTCCSVDVS